MVGRAPGWLSENVSLKVASVVLATFVWMYVRSEEKPLQVFAVPLELEGLPADVALSGEVLDSVSVRVRAPDSILRNLTPGRFRARVRLDGARPGELNIPLAPDSIKAPLGVQVVRVDPRSMSLRVERRVTREIPVVARISGVPAPGFEYDGHTLTPDRVTVEGPEGIVQQVRESVTDPVTIDERSASFEARVDIAPDRAGARVTGPSTVLLRVGIRRQRITQAYAGVSLAPSFTPGVTHRATFVPQTITVVLGGTQETLSTITAGNIRAVLDLEGMGPRDAPYAVKPRIVMNPPELGTSVAIHSLSDTTISVTISR